MSSLFRLGDLGCCHIPEAWAGLFPRMDCHGADGAGEDVPANEPCPMDLVSLFSAWAHNLQIQEDPPTVKLCLLHPKDVEPLGWKSFEKPRGLLSPGGGVPPPVYFLRVAQAMGASVLHKVVLQELGCVQETGVRKEEGMGHKPWVFVLAHSTLTIQEQCFPQGSGSPSNQSWA